MVSNLKKFNKPRYSHQNKISNLIRNSEYVITNIHTASSSIKHYEFMVNNFHKYAQTYHKPIHTITHKKTVQKCIIDPNSREYVNWSKLWSLVKIMIWLYALTNCQYHWEGWPNWSSVPPNWMLGWYMRTLHSGQQRVRGSWWEKKCLLYLLWMDVFTSVKEVQLECDGGAFTNGVTQCLDR